MFETYLNNRLFTLFICPLILGSLTVFSFQPFNLSAINFLVLPIFFYLLVYIKKKSKSIYRKKPFKKNLFLFGTSFGFGYFICGIFWITNSLTFDQNLKFLIPFALILIPLFLSLFFSLITLIIGQYLNYNFSSILVLSSSLAISDYIRAKILTGFPWNLWSYSFSWNTEVIQILNKIGLFAFNLLSITIFIIPAVIFFQIDLKKKIIILILPVLLILYLFPGSLIGYFLYGNFGQQPNLITNPIGTSINHLIFFSYITSLAIIVRLRVKNILTSFKIILFISGILEILHLIVPNRAFELYDLLANITGVTIVLLINSFIKWQKYF